jgi:Fic family protein
MNRAAGHRVVGHYVRQTVTGEEVLAFLPAPLPPREPPLALDQPSLELLRHAERALERLELAGALVPSLDWFLYAFVRKEAVVSSQIEGTQATLEDLLSFEAGAPVARADEDLLEVCNHLDALTWARDEMRRPDGLPLSLRLLHEAHRRLMKGVRGATRQPGEVRRSQNWIGGTRPGNAVFVPPPAERVPELLGALESYIHTEDDLPPLVRTGLLHVQFESIHPYLDGNGRIGRLLITLLLEHWDLLSRPLLYLSLFFKRHRQEYYRLLNRVREVGDWEGWVRFFLEGVAVVAEEATEAARDLSAIVHRDRERALAAGKMTVVGLRLLERLPEHPVVTIPGVVELLETTKPTAAKAVAALEKLGILGEASGRQRNRVYRYTAYLERLRTGTELE